MRGWALLLAAASLAACDRNNENEQPEAEAKPIVLTYEGAGATDPAAVLKHGERVAAVLGCKSCHGDNLQGQNVTADEPQYGDMNAPNITLLLAKYDDRALDKLIRHGVPLDGREFWFMPSETFQYVNDADFAALVAFLRTHKPAGKQLPPIRKGPGFLADVEKGAVTNAVATVMRFKQSQPVDLGPQHALGRYIAMTTCTECHNSELQGYEGFTPNLDIAGSYSSEELTRLLTTGEGKVKKDLGLMTETAKHRFSRLTPSERAAVVAYIKARVDRPQ
jgi:mono/diheme cytochrome c family protein